MKNKFKNKRVLVYGMSVSGVWAARLLQKLKACIFLFDDNTEKLLNCGLKKCTLLQTISENDVKTMDYVILSPSIEKDNIVVKFAEKYKIKIYSELEFASIFSNNVVAVTGTNGKTTTIELIESILNTQKKAIACGNIGYPLSKAVLKNKRYIKVCEVSSFMLEHADEFSPYIASVLNIKPDHLIRHKTMDEYSKLKLSIFKNQSYKDYAVINLDEKLHINTNAENITYSYNHHADVRVKEGAIFYRQTKIINLNEIPLKGKHNIYNVMCAVCFGVIMGIKISNIKKAILNFKPDRFRNEYIGVVKGVKFINDSKSTNIASTIASVNSVRGSVVLMLCGSNKQLDYAELFKDLSKRVKEIVVFGDISDSVIKSNQDFSIHKEKDLSLAFKKATDLAQTGDTILFSPSSASYDHFSSYIERGQKFNEQVKAYESIQEKE